MINIYLSSYVEIYTPKSLICLKLGNVSPMCFPSTPESSVLRNEWLTSGGPGGGTHSATFL